jgi:hypothetical protein
LDCGGCPDLRGDVVMATEKRRASNREWARRMRLDPERAERARAKAREAYRRRCERDPNYTPRPKRVHEPKPPRGSLWIPDGILPPTSDPKYQVTYHRERMKRDPDYAERYRKHQRAANARWYARKMREKREKEG